MITSRDRLQSRAEHYDHSPLAHAVLRWGLRVMAAGGLIQLAVATAQLWPR